MQLLFELGFINGETIALHTSNVYMVIYLGVLCSNTSEK